MIDTNRETKNTIHNLQYMPGGVFGSARYKLKSIRENKNVQIFDPVNSYQIVSILKGAVDRGTGRRTKITGFEIGGKTGTTNKNTDAWFIGFTCESYSFFETLFTQGAVHCLRSKSKQGRFLFLNSRSVQLLNLKDFWSILKIFHLIQVLN